MTSLLVPLCRAGNEPNPFPKVVDGQGIYLELEDGSRVIDAASMGTCAILGHRNPELVSAVQVAADSVFTTEFYATPERERAVETMFSTGFAGEDWVGAVRFTPCASDANDLAILLAQALTGRAPFVSRKRSYHGAIGLSRVASDHPPLHGGLADREGGLRLPPDMGIPVRHFDAPECGIRPEQTSCDDTHCDHLAPVVKEADGACAILDDYGSVAVYPSVGFQDGVARAARDAGAFWINDEAVTGMGRTGRWFGFQRGAERPDMVVLGKTCTGGGAPGGALIISKAILEELGERRWQSVSSFFGHHVTTAAIETCFSIVERDGLVERAREIGPILGQGLMKIADRHEVVDRVVGEGTLWTVEMKSRPEHAPMSWLADGSTPSPASILKAEALKRGALLHTTNACSTWIAPALVSTDEELSRLLEILDESLAVLTPELTSVA
jgi:4-aminobutyrate aminotransferase-like enzyme